LSHTRRSHPWLAFAAVVAISPAVASQAPSHTVPLRAGLTIVTAINEPELGDYESLKRVTDVNERAVTLSYSSDAPAKEDPLATLLGQQKARPAGKPATQSFRVRRTVHRADLQNARVYAHSFSENSPESYPGSTALGVSSAVLAELKTKGQTELTVFDTRSAGGALGGLLGGLLGGEASKELDDMSKVTGTLRIVKGGPATLTVLVNGAPTPLPVVQARGTIGDFASEYFFLDDPANPLSLKYSHGEHRLQVVRIEFPVDATGSAAASTRTIQRQLASTGKAEIYGIYFDFASDRIKEESGPVLTEIAKVLADNPAWTLSVDGHTDNIGGDAPNLDLSKRRAAAVRQVLVAEYKVSGARLTTDGFGAARPKDTNATLEGRARNRRVELIRK
jgi:outer membrane protein OmpA-like peptidoglycan-associated protein